MEVHIAPVEDNRGRKRIRDENRWKRNIKKREKLSHLKGEERGCVYGLMYEEREETGCEYDGTLLVVGFSLESEPSHHSWLMLHMPTEVDLCGIIHFGDALHNDTSLQDILQKVDMTDNPLIVETGGGKLKMHFLVHDRLEETPYEVLAADELWRNFLHVRLRTIFPLTCEATVTGVKNALQAKRKKIASGQVSFHLEGSSVYVLGEAAEVGAAEAGARAVPTIAQLVDSVRPEQSYKKKKFSINNVEIVPVNIVMKATRDLVSEKPVKTAVKMVTTQGKPAYCISMPLVVSGLTLVHRDTHSEELYNILVETACRALRLIEYALIQQLGQVGVGDGAGLTIPDTYHFLPAELGHFITRVLPRVMTEDDTENDRRRLHQSLGLTTDRPVFRCGNAYLLEKTSLLLNPHEGLPAAATPPSVVRAVVRGRYTYHHYMQDQFNDDGWGCAYRSLQTLCSWFSWSAFDYSRACIDGTESSVWSSTTPTQQMLVDPTLEGPNVKETEDLFENGYTTERIPTHRKIQQCLVDIGDKPSSFVGSKQWIGSTEVSFCLESLLKVQSRIIFANSGAELKEYSPELVHHFQKHGSPIMIGGGVLAHTILGVEYDTESGEVRYLILDPHYTGVDDLSTVIGKGWCAWKNSHFWNNTAHYNLCLPQTRPCI